MTKRSTLAHPDRHSGDTMTSEENPNASDVDLGPEAGEWAVIAMACVACSDGFVDPAEREAAKELVASTAVITQSLGPAFGEQLFHDTVERIRSDPDNELEFLKQELRELASKIRSQEHRDSAFQTLIAIATADRELEIREREMMRELRDIIGSQVMVPLPHREIE